MLSPDLLRKLGILCLVAGVLMLGFVGWVFVATVNGAGPLQNRTPVQISVAPTEAVETARITADDLAISPLAASLGSELEADSSLLGVERSIFLETENGRTRHNTTAATLGAFLEEINYKIYATDKIYADDNLVSAFDLDRIPLPEAVTVGRFVNITVVDEGFTQVIRTSEETVQDALLDAEITLFTADETIPALDSAISPDMVIEIQRSIPVVLEVDGNIIQTRTISKSSLAVLEAAAVTLAGADYVTPSPEIELQPNDLIEVIRVTENFETADEEIPFESEWVGTDELELDQRAQLQAGAPGILRKRTRIRYENGVEVAREPDGEWVEQPPQNEIMGYGTRVEIRTLNTETGPVTYYRKVEMRVTSYMAQTSGKPPDDPWYGITASGVVAGYGVVAVDPTVVPFRSNVYVPGYGQAFVGDTGGGVKGRWIDLGYEDNWDTFVYWSGTVDVYFLTPVPEKINYLIPNYIP